MHDDAIRFWATNRRTPSDFRLPLDANCHFTVCSLQFAIGPAEYLISSKWAASATPTLRQHSTLHTSLYVQRKCTCDITLISRPIRVQSITAVGAHKFSVRGPHEHTHTHTHVAATFNLCMRNCRCCDGQIASASRHLAIAPSRIFRITAHFVVRLSVRRQIG